MLHVPLDFQVLVPIAWDRYICMKKKSHHHPLLRKGRLRTLMPYGNYRHMEILYILIAEHIWI